MSAPELWDDELRDYRQRYQLPEQWLWDEASWPRVQYDGYMKVILELLPPPPAEVLDIGCGPGFGAKHMTARGYHVTGLDFNERGIAFGNVLVPEARLLHADARLLAQNEQLQGRFDAATIIEVLEHIPPDFHDQVIEGARAALREGGSVIVSVPSNRLVPSRWDYKHFELHEVTELLTRHGFTLDAPVYQCRVTVLQSPWFWRLLDNRYYDLKILRRLARAVFLRYHNLASGPKDAGRFIIRGIKHS